LYQGANEITVPAVFPVTVVASCDSPKSPRPQDAKSPKTKEATFHPELRATRSATCSRNGCENGLLAGAEARCQDGCDGEMILRLTAHLRVEWSMQAARIPQNGLLRCREGRLVCTEYEADIPHIKIVTRRNKTGTRATRTYGE